MNVVRGSVVFELIASSLENRGAGLAFGSACPKDLRQDRRFADVSMGTKRYSYNSPRQEVVWGSESIGNARKQGKLSLYSIKSLAERITEAQSS